MQRRSTIAFLMTLPLIILILVLVAYPAGYAIYLSMLDRSMTRFVGLANFAFLVSRGGFWMVVYQTSLFAVTAVALKAIIGFVLAHLLYNIPTKGQRKWRGMLLVSWVIPPAMSVLAWRLLFDPSFSAFNWILQHLGMDRIGWVGEPGWARFSVILVTVWFGAPFFMVMFLASLTSVPEELYEAASIDGATWWQRLRYVTFPMMRNVIAITMLFSLIGSFAVAVLLCLLSVASLAYFFAPPALSFTIDDPQHVVMVAAFCATGVIVAWLMGTARQEKEAATNPLEVHLE